MLVHFSRNMEIFNDEKYREFARYLESKKIGHYLLLTTENSEKPIGSGTISTTQALNHLSSMKARKESRDHEPIKNIDKMESNFDILGIIYRVIQKDC